MESKTVIYKQNPPSTPAPSPSTRRPRVREVSSRFMSPISSSSSSSSAGDLHSLTSNTPKHQIQRSVSAQRLRRQLKMSDGDENHRSSETAARSLDSPFTLLKTGKTSKQKPLKENSNRFDTPTPIRSRLSQHQLGTGSAAAKLLESSIKGQEKSNGSDLLPKLSWRTQQPKVFNGYVPPSPLNRSSSPMRCDGHESSSYSLIGSSLPPVAPNLKILVDTKKQRKVPVPEQLEEVHSMKLLHNRYLQWKFANANAEAKTQAQKEIIESMLYSFGLKISQLDDSVQQKRIEVQRLSRVKALCSITESQIPCLEQWSAIEEDYSASLSQTVQALSNASLRLPLDVDVTVDNRELGEALVAASKAIDGITQNVGNYMSKAQEVESLVSQLATVSDRERSLTEDCGIALRKSQASHIEECSLRSQLIQQTSKEIQVNTNLVLIVEI